MLKPLDLLLRRIVKAGNLTIQDARGCTTRFGDGTGTPIALTFTDTRVEREIVLDPQLAVGEAYVAGRLVMTEGTIYDFLEIVLKNLDNQPLPRWTTTLDWGRFLVRRFSQFNPAGRSKRNVSHHYDIPGAIYDLFLDKDRQYSCAYFDGDVGLEEAQLTKKRHIAAKLAIEPGHRVLDIGCGWGGLGLYLASIAEADVTGITLSEAQLAIARERAQRLGLARRVRFEMQDYRHTEGRFDRIVSVGMFEHVGVNHYDTYFRRIRDLLSDDGVALVHTIGRADPPGVTNAFIAKYIFPGGYIPALSEVMPAIERAGLILTDTEILRLHYAKTLKLWRQRFLARRAEAIAVAGEEFARMWEFYLAGSEAAFRYQNLVVFQLQLTRRLDALPLTRTYIAEREAELARREAGLAAAQRMAGE